MLHKFKKHAELQALVDKMTVDKPACQMSADDPETTDSDSCIAIEAPEAPVVLIDVSSSEEDHQGNAAKDNVGTVAKDSSVDFDALEACLFTTPRQRISSKTRSPMSAGKIDGGADVFSNSLGAVAVLPSDYKDLTRKNKRKEGQENQETAQAPVPGGGRQAWPGGAAGQS